MYSIRPQTVLINNELGYERESTPPPEVDNDHKRKRESTPPPSISKRPPATPFCKRRAVALDPLACTMLQRRQQIAVLNIMNQSFSFRIHDTDIHINRIIECFNDGAYHEAYLVEGTGLKVTTFVLKIFKTNWIEGSAKALQYLVQQNHTEYFELKNRFGDQRIATHFDLEILGKEKKPTHGCSLVQYIPHPYPVPKECATLFPEGTPERKADDQLKKFFADVDPENPPDLRHPNVGIDEEGTVVLFDHGDFHDEGAAAAVLHKNLCSFAPEGSERWLYLCPKSDLQ